MLAVGFPQGVHGVGQVTVVELAQDDAVLGCRGGEGGCLRNGDVEVLNPGPEDRDSVERVTGIEPA